MDTPEEIGYAVTWEGNPLETRTERNWDHLVENESALVKRMMAGIPKPTENAEVEGIQEVDTGLPRVRGLLLGAGRAAAKCGNGNGSIPEKDIIETGKGWGANETTTFETAGEFG